MSCPGSRGPVVGALGVVLVVAGGVVRSWLPTPLHVRVALSRAFPPPRHSPARAAFPSLSTALGPHSPSPPCAPGMSRQRGGGGGGRDALEGKAPQRRPQKRFDRRWEDIAEAVGGGYCRLQMPLSPALGVRQCLGIGWAPWRGPGEGGSPPSNAFLGSPLLHRLSLLCPNRPPSPSMTPSSSPKAVLIRPSQPRARSVVAAAGARQRRGGAAPPIGGVGVEGRQRRGVPVQPLQRGEGGGLRPAGAAGHVGVHAGLPQAGGAWRAHG